MCGGGGGAPATITAPNYAAENRMLQLQMDAMRPQRGGPVDLEQTWTNTALDRQARVLEELREVKVQRANETQANVQRLTALMGAPVPEKSAKAPTVADNRTGQKRATGKTQLRIDRGAGNYSTGSGVGLNLS